MAESQLSIPACSGWPTSVPSSAPSHRYVVAGPSLSYAGMAALVARVAGQPNRGDPPFGHCAIIAEYVRPPFSAVSSTLARPVSSENVAPTFKSEELKF